MKAIFESRELRENVGNVVTTPNGKNFKVILWQTAKEHGLNTTESKYGSRLKIDMDGKIREFFNAPYKGSEKLTEFYKECGLKTSGQSGEHEPKKTFTERFEALKTEAKKASAIELKEAIAFLSVLAKEAEKREKEEKEEKELSALLQSADKKKLLAFLKKNK